MSLSIDTQDLINHPGIVKRVTVDHSAIVPVGEEGDEKYVQSVSTTAYSNNTDRTAISDLYITDFKIGWARSSGFTGSGGKYALSSSAYKLYTKIDDTTSGTTTVSGVKGFYEIELTHSDGTPISGEIIAIDMQAKIRALASSLVTADAGYSIAYKNVSVEYKNSKFWIVSGSVGNLYAGTNRTSVKMEEVPGDGAYDTLGFNLAMTSEEMDSVVIEETYLNGSCPAGTGSITVGSDIGVSVGDSLMIRDNINTDYFTAISGTTGVTVNIPTLATNGFDGISNTYVSGAAKIQILKEQDPNGYPTGWFTDIDSIVRHGIKVFTHEIDYSS
jgi:hypothetical protein